MTIGPVLFCPWGDEMVDLATVEVVQDEVGWLVVVNNPGRRPQEYRCASQQQAKSLAAVMQGTKAATGVPGARVKPPPDPKAPAGGSASNNPAPTSPSDKK
jgi:hypothetical protein